ncbi:LysR family transcriptional regulator [Paenibacillus sp. P36]|uniref:LysR family transcriptional regulator n=1 Tax=Paenibacillus sp. P36 TaxID=3342538 RepID=UPI0038B41713
MPNVKLHKASKHLHVSQSAITARIKALESTIDIHLHLIYQLGEFYPFEVAPIIKKGTAACRGELLPCHMSYNYRSSLAQ